MRIRPLEAVRRWRSGRKPTGVETSFGFMDREGLALWASEKATLERILTKRFVQDLFEAPVEAGKEARAPLSAAANEAFRASLRELREGRGWRRILSVVGPSFFGGLLLGTVWIAMPPVFESFKPRSEAYRAEIPSERREDPAL